MNIETREQRMNILKSILINTILKLEEQHLRLMIIAANEFAGGLTDQDALDSVSAAIIDHLQTMTKEERVMTLKYIHALKDFREVTA